MPRDDAIALIGVILLLIGITVQFGPGWALMTAGIIFLYAGIRLDTDKAEPPETGRIDV
jgi:hypothetical protein